ncbi:MAG: zinc ribbon domain-containing protein [Promethearchaeota archaeon]
MKYQKNQYSESFSICTFIIAGGFLYWGINTFITEGLTHWWGYISIAIGVAILVGQIVAITNRSKLRNVVLAEIQENPEITIEDVSKSTGITTKDIQGIILDLKASGQLRAKFDTETGQIKHLLTSDKEYVSGAPTGSIGQAKFCSNCGTPITKESAQYCAYCGGKI